MSEFASGPGLPPGPLPPVNDASIAEEIARRADTVRSRGEGGAPAIPKVSRRSLKGTSGRVAIVDGCRTPFAKAGTELAEMDVVDLAGVAAAELVSRSGIDPEEIDLSVFGCVVPALYAPNLGREVVFRASLPMRVPGNAVSLACVSANQAIVDVAEAILLGEAEVGLAGGAESLSNVPLQFGRRAAKRFMQLSKARSVGGRGCRLRADAGLRDLLQDVHHAWPTGRARCTTG